MVPIARYAFVVMRTANRLLDDSQSVHNTSSPSRIITAATIDHIDAVHNQIAIVVVVAEL